MTDLGKYPLDDDELDKVNGGTQFAFQGKSCGSYSPVNDYIAIDCSNCRHFDGSVCDLD